MLTEIKRISIGSKRRYSEYVGKTADKGDIPIYEECYPQPTKSEFEANETKYYTLSGTTYDKCSEGDAYATLTAKLYEVESTGTVTFDGATFLTQESVKGFYDYHCEADNASKSVTATDESFTTSSVTLTKATLFEKIQQKGTHNFIYDGENWTLNDEDVDLADYGLVVADGVTLTENDKIAVTITVKWYEDDTEITPATYGITVSGNPTGGDTIRIEVYEVPNVFHERVQMNGSTFYDFQAKKTYRFDEDGAVGSEWIEQ